MGLGQGDRGYAMAALLVGMTVMAVLMSAAMPVWSHFAKREKEEELIWRGQQYARAIGLFQRKYANTFPPTVDVLVEQKFLRKKYKDPVTGEDFQAIPATGMPGGAAGMPGGGAAGMPGMIVPGGAQSAPGAPRPAPAGQPRSAAQMTSVGTTVQAGIGIQGVVSKSDKTSIKIYNGRTKYNEWAFVYMASTQAPGAAGGPPVPRQPGLFGRPGQPNQPGLFGQPGTMPGQPGQPGPPGGGFTPFGGTDRRPGIGQPSGAPMGPVTQPPPQPNPFVVPPRRPPGT